MNDFNSKYRLFLESLEEKRRLDEFAGVDDIKTIGRGTASSNELTTDARKAASQNQFSGKEWSPQERKIFQTVVRMFQYMIENSNIAPLTQNLRIFFQRSLDQLNLDAPEPQNKDAKQTGGSLTVGVKTV